MVGLAEVKNMMYTIRVYETRTVLCEYEIDADDQADAEDKAEAGETVCESELGAMEVVNRIIDRRRETE